MSQPYSRVAVLIQKLVACEGRTITEYRDPRHVTRVTRQGRPRRGEASTTFVVTIGKPNYAERQVIKGRVAVGAPFPVIKAKAFRRKR